MNRAGVVHPVSEAADPPLADDRFWESVAQRQLAADAELALLETWSATTSRWHLIGAGIRLDAVRARLKPGALLTVYPDPPRAPDETLPMRADELLTPRMPEPGPDNAVVGLIREPETGALRFARLRTAEEVTGWLSRAERAAACGLYPSDPAGQPGVLRAIVPQAQPVPEPSTPAVAAPADAEVRRHLLRTVLGLLVLVAMLVLCGRTLNIAFTVQDRPPPALDGLETRAGCTNAINDAVRGNDAGKSGAVESGSCEVDGSTVMFATFRNDKDRNGWIVFFGLMGGQNFGIGPGWAIVADDPGTAARVAAALGGRVTKPDVPFQVPTPSG
jgi:hypothetical protein